jgi:molecular chaperone Hsp33
MEQDSLKRVICETLNLRAYTATTLSTVREITGLHCTSPNATVALGRTITAAALLSATLKPDSDQSLLLKIEGSGPIREIHAQADARGNLRGYAANPGPDLEEDLGGISFSRTIGAGFLTVRKDIGMKEPYSSITPLHAGEVAGDVAYYLSASEQIPSALIIALTLEKDGSVSSSGGILIQTFPGTPEEVITGVEHAIYSLKTDLGTTLKDGKEITSVLDEIFGHEPFSIIESRPLRAACRCTRKVIRSALLNIHSEELADMLSQDHGAEVVCTFCTKKYHFNEHDLEEMIMEKSGDPGGGLSGGKQNGLH